MPQRPLTKLRSICLALPEAEQRETWDIQTFRVRDKIFALFSDEERPRLTCKAPRGAQAILVGAAPERFFVPAYVGHKGWVGVWLDGAVDWQEIAGLVRRSWRMTAPKRLAATVAE